MNFKRTLQVSVFLLFTIAIVDVSGQRDVSQNPNYGPDSLSRVACGNNLSTLAEYMKINLPEYALSAWREVFEKCPAASKNIYINGAKIFQYLIEKEADPEIQSAYFDTLMLIYDRRIEYFGEEGNVLGRKGKDMLRYNSQDYESAYLTLKQSFLKSGADIDPVVTVGLIETGVLMYKASKITAKELLDNYISVSNATENEKNKGGRPDVAEQVFSRINAALAKAGLSNCAEIEEAFKEKLANGSADAGILSLISDLLVKSSCENTDFYGEVNEKLFVLEPSSDKAYTLAWYYIRKEKFDAVISFLNKAIELETDLDKQAHYYYQMAIICNTKMNLQKDAVTYSRKALELLPNWGEPYFVIANAYLQSGKDCFEGGFERSTVYWVATDLCIKAKGVDKSIEEKANSLIADYARFYPNNEEVFFRSLQEGSAYTVGCWIDEKTTVRVKK